ncbi:glutamyl-tRNA synthetase-like protein [Thermochaetoides thermophila DSM 1495]|uniref:glutamate--tRNA ligase n=1 Tax=Chaetomium thermophilum (strain DSM 1495 / CBS 144.50 / IMI 039719) TaxID=759272 RepID=G0S5P0_CHATD|nr:glutamyl-tRNA synthetase-like protein [Thermochaetoides thermophila DSM 1495]EGS20659.1 glutamyl-tRNA synthetase-like protein [Thermochaetoides thermophila DSM 1495]
MKIDDIKALEKVLAGDFRSIEPHLQALDKHLILRTYLDGYTLSEVDTKIWQVLRSNRAAFSFIKRGNLVNLTRWFNFIEDNYPEIQEEIKARDAAAKAKVAAASKAGGSYNLALQDTDKGVVTRFLPEPSGYLHIGHAKAALLSDYFAHIAYNGQLRLRLDDTNPSKEKQEYQDAIIEDLAMMGIRPDSVTYTSDYFDYLYEMCIRLIKEGHAYADDTDQETMRDERFKGIASKRRDRSVEENLRIFEEMKKGSEEGLRHCIRAKISVDNPNKAMRDPVIYRCNVETPHHRTGTKWKMYPTYDFACPIVDSYEGVTHAMRSTEYTDRNPQYQWFQDTLKLRKVYIWDFARMNFIKTFLSKRKLAKLVDTGRVWGWDDPRMPTIRGIRRRGMTINSLRDFILKQGPSRNIVTMDWTTFWANNKKEIDPIAPRYTAVLQKDVVKVTVTGAEAPAEPYKSEKPLHPKNKNVGTKQVVYASEILIDQADAKSFKDGEEITLMSWGNAFVRNIPSADPIPTLTCELNLQGDVKTTEKKITWLASNQKLVPAELWDFDYLITKDVLQEDDNMEDFLNPNTATMDDAWCDEAAAVLKKDDIIQLERRGYYRVDKGLDDWKDGEEGPKGKRLVLFCIPTGKTGPK